MTTLRKLPTIAPSAAINAQAIGSGASRALSIAGEIIREVIVARPWECAYENFCLAGGGAVLRWRAHLAHGFTGGTPVPLLNCTTTAIHYGFVGLSTTTLLTRRVDPVARCKSAKALL